MMAGLKKFPTQGRIGLGLILIFWPLNWFAAGVRTGLGFFPLWLGYILLMDGWVFLRKRSSLLSRSWWRFILLFLLSIPLWWVFEGLNLRLQNWVYLGRDSFSNLEFAVLSSLSFSTVIPAVLESAEFAASFSILSRLQRGPRLDPGRGTEIAVFLGGWLCLTAILLWPKLFFPLVWLSIYFIMEPINIWLGNTSLVSSLRKGDWRPIGALFAGVLITAFFWEMWNFYSFPKWIYSIPFDDKHIASAWTKASEVVNNCGIGALSDFNQVLGGGRDGSKAYLTRPINPCILIVYPSAGDKTR